MTYHLSINKMKKLFKYIHDNAKSNYRTVMINGKIANNIANMGADVGSHAIVFREGGEYNKFTVEILSEIKPLFVSHRICRAIEFIHSNELIKAIKILCIQEECVKYGNDSVYYVIEKWFGINNIDLKLLDNIIDINNYDTKKFLQENDLYNRLKIQRHDPLDCSIRIIGLGENDKGCTVVPEDWMDREFKNAYDLHNEMNKLEWRKNKPPVQFCCIHSMNIIENNSFKINCNDVGKYFKNNKNIKLIICKSNGTDKIDTCLSNFYNIDNNMLRDMHIYFDKKNNIMICYSHDIFNEKPTYTSHFTTVSVLASRLQKCIRRGSGGSKILYDTICQMNKSKCYNLPDQKYARVSGTRQMLWRSYISIVEEVCGYENSDIYDLMDFMMVAYICHVFPDLQINDKYIVGFIRTLLNIQNWGNKWDWRNGNIVDSNKFKTYGYNYDEKCCESRIIDSMIFALDYMPMMSGDRKMLSKCINLVAENNIKFKMKQIQTVEALLKKRDALTERQILEASNDMHCYPNIILQIQGSIPYNPSIYTTDKISSFIWEKSSKYNYRDPKSVSKINGEEEIVMKELGQIQKSYNDKIYTYKSGILDKVKFEPNSIQKIIKNNNWSPDVSRLGFLLLFGKKFKINSEGKNKPSLDIIIAGDPSKPCKVKKYNSDKYVYLEGAERYDGEKRFIKHIFEKGVYIDVPNPPIGYKWTINKKVKISGKILDSDAKTMTNTIQFYVDNIPVPSFQSKLFLSEIGHCEELFLDKDNVIARLVQNAIYTKSDVDGFKLNMILRKIGSDRKEIHDFRVFDVSLLMMENKKLISVWSQLYSRIIMDNTIEIGPVDRMGNKTHNSISYAFEGIFWRLMNVLYMLYPEAISLSGNFKYHIDTNVPSYNNMISMIKKQIHVNNFVDDSYKNDIKIITKLWIHQEKSVKHISENMISSKIRKGFGDASHVGAGKTLTALGIMAKLYNYNKQLQDKTNIGNGFLIMVPNVQLYDTWSEEIDKHTNGMHYLFQQSDGTLYDKNKKILQYRKATYPENNQINSNTVVITTMGRIRDHPLINKWIVVVIDECLTVQNKDALQTEEALRQTVLSQFNVILMSANFFRSRFDKLFYMLKMLRTGLPEKSEYLDTILSESLVCNIMESTRKWICNIHKFKLNTEQKQQYEKIKNLLSRDDYEKIYMLLSQFINNSCDYEKYFLERIKLLEKERPECKILIYAKSKDEADKLSKYKNIGRYPDINMKHVVVSYAEGTYGLNNLIEFDTILTRPPNADYVPQMKGRLDRTGQKSEILYLEYILLMDTIEEAELIKLEYANHFHSSYIMPLAEYYKLAVDFKTNA